MAAGQFAGKTALVTGGNGGIGQAIISRLQADGATVVSTDLVADPAGLADHHVIGDLMDSRFCEGLPAQAAALTGRLDILCNNAGIITRGVITETSDDDLSRSLAINVEAPFRLCRSTIPIMAEQGGGAIVNTASCWGLQPGPAHPIYVMTKAALASLTQCLGRDHAHQGIRVNAVCPNEVNTGMLRTGFKVRGLDPDAGVATLNQTVPLGRIAEPEDIADVIAFLASNDARYMVGALLEVNGGKPVG